MATCVRQELAGPLSPPPASLHDRRDQHHHDSTILARPCRVERSRPLAWRNTASPDVAPGVKENAVFDAVMSLAKAEADEERLGELLVDAFREGEVRVKPAGEKPERRGRRANVVADSKILADIRAKNPKSDGRKYFIDRLTAPALGRRPPVNVDTCHAAGTRKPSP